MKCHRHFLNAGLNSMVTGVLLFLISCNAQRPWIEDNQHLAEIFNLILNESRIKKYSNKGDTILIIVNDRSMNNTLKNWVNDNLQSYKVEKLLRLKKKKMQKVRLDYAGIIIDDEDQSYRKERKGLGTVDLWQGGIDDMIWTSDIYYDGQLRYAILKYRNSGEGWLYVIKESGRELKMTEIRMLFIE